MKAPKSPRYYVILLLFSSLTGRSIHRPPDPHIPTLTARWKDQPEQSYMMRHSHLEERPLFKKFDKDYFMSHLLPQGKISYRNHPEQHVGGALLSELMEDLLAQMQRRSTEFKHFKILKSLDFNSKRRWGCIILKFEDYPFVVKMFVESPQSFVKPFSKGFHPSCFFMMGGGINRHLSGFTRIKNLENMRKKIQADPYWSQRLDTPRKWFWIPKDARWIELAGHNIGTQKELVTHIPAIYAIVADHVQSGASLSLLKKQDRMLGMKMSHFLGNSVDPHIQNFMVEKETGKFVLIDSEHFPTMVGLERPLNVNGYLSWYIRLACKCAKDTFGRSKRCRHERQTCPKCEYLPLYEDQEIVAS